MEGEKIQKGQLHEKIKVGNTAEVIPINRKRWKDHVDRMDEDKWLKTAWNYKPTGQRA
jgi:hypothetical protein